MKPERSSAAGHRLHTLRGRILAVSASAGLLACAAQPGPAAAPAPPPAPAAPISAPPIASAAAPASSSAAPPEVAPIALPLYPLVTGVYRFHALGDALMVNRLGTSLKS